MPFPARLTIETRQLADELAAVPHGAEISYSRMSVVAGFDILKKRYSLTRARALVLAESGAVFDTCRGRGLRRLVNDEIPAVGSAARRRARQGMRRSRMTMTRAMNGLNDVDAATLRKFLAETSLLGLLEMLARDRTFRQLEKIDKPLPVAEAAKTLLSLLGSGAK